MENLPSDDEPTDEDGGDPMPEEQRKPEPSREPTLFVTDAEILRRLGVSEKTGYAAIHRLEKSGLGFPEKHRTWGRKRYWPAVKQWFDRHYGVERTRG